MSNSHGNGLKRGPIWRSLGPHKDVVNKYNLKTKSATMYNNFYNVSKNITITFCFINLLFDLPQK